MSTIFFSFFGNARLYDKLVSPHNNTVLLNSMCLIHLAIIPHGNVVNVASCPSQSCEYTNLQSQFRSSYYPFSGAIAKKQKHFEQKYLF